MMRNLRTPLLILMFLFASSPAWAAAYGNPAAHFDPGQSGIGLAVNEVRLTPFFDYGISDPGTLRVFFGLVDFKGADGSEIGVGYRHEIPQEMHINQYPIKLGALGMYRLGSVDTKGGSADYNQLDVGAGAAIHDLVEDLVPYVLVVFRRFDVDGGDSETDLGLVGGAEFLPSEEIVLGAELHFGIKDEFISLFAEFKF